MGLTSSAVEKFADLARGRMEAMAGEERDEEEEAEDRMSSIESALCEFLQRYCIVYSI